jgi:hypothetical protein
MMLDNIMIQEQKLKDLIKQEETAIIKEERKSRSTPRESTKNPA